MNPETSDENRNHRQYHQQHHQQHHQVHLGSVQRHQQQASSLPPYESRVTNEGSATSSELVSNTGTRQRDLRLSSLPVGSGESHYRGHQINLNEDNPMNPLRRYYNIRSLKSKSIDDILNFTRLFGLNFLKVPLVQQRLQDLQSLVPPIYCLQSDLDERVGCLVSAYSFVIS